MKLLLTINTVLAFTNDTWLNRPLQIFDIMYIGEKSLLDFNESLSLKIKEAHFDHDIISILTDKDLQRALLRKRYTIYDMNIEEWKAIKSAAIKLNIRLRYLDYTNCRSYFAKNLYTLLVD